MNESEKIKFAYRNNPLEKFGIHGSQEQGHELEGGAGTKDILFYCFVVVVVLLSGRKVHFIVLIE